ncbi:MAG TPA: hypothetical protein RMH85_36060 [Polyangiaceae bacterium LLY-WYZ-15_(1-7)]|nr:hypothetical protein [Myxococcales bacterium]MAT29143.1 hypothetical protein [Sandaracinus sp.]HJL03398.1 hypothetical protein [Polyangiaceae bacterium LLY-WYZ-15_(1-7)]MBJ74883.1 hypothetical protein [Sandaracinus sp.]HJL13957.1 hypothetical protein [Polyangiaceae bacterium LLY-WYZ-15_(1-7)]
MLPPFIIDQIRKREDDEHRRHERPVVELPIAPKPIAPKPASDPQRDDESSDRGVVVIDLFS